MTAATMCGKKTKNIPVTIVAAPDVALSVVVPATTPVVELEVEFDVVLVTIAAAHGVAPSMTVTATAPVVE